MVVLNNIWKKSEIHGAIVKEFYLILFKIAPWNHCAFTLYVLPKIVFTLELTAHFVHF